MRQKKLMYNTISSLINEIAAILCAMILPKFFLMYYGSSVNGLVSSITQFLSFIAFLDLGVGAVVQSSLYAPLAKNDNKEISLIMISAKKFFNKIAIFFIGYIILLIFLYPAIINNKFDFLFTAALILSIAITQIAQYFFGVVNQLLLGAHQKSYIQMGLHTIALIVNTIVCVIFIKMGCSIQLVKLLSSMIFFIRPIGMWLYVKKNYSINYNLELNEEPIKQKWNGFAQHLAAVVLQNTDTAMLTLFSTLENVSIYSVYYLVVHGVRKIIERFSTGMQSLLGDILACGEYKKLKSISAQFEFIIHNLVTLLFGCTAVLLVPFILVYTNGINDANYNAPLFAIILTLSQAVYCIRIPYNMLVKAAGAYKETQLSAILEMLLNLSITAIVVIKYGLIGVAVGTLVAMLYRTTYLAYYASRNILKIKFRIFIKYLFTDLFVFIVMILISKYFEMGSYTYGGWILYSIKITIVNCFILIIANILFYYKKLKRLYEKFKNKIVC